MRSRPMALALFGLVAAPPLAWAASNTSFVPPPTKSVAQARLPTDQKTMTADQAKIANMQTVLKAAQTQLTVDLNHAASDRAMLANNAAIVKGLESQLTAAMAKRDYVAAAKIQPQLTTYRNQATATNKDLNAVNAKIKADQAAVNKANEAVIVANRQLGLDTGQFNADTYYAQFGK
jgi:hypothetical protein